MSRPWRPRCEQFLQLDVRKLRFPPAVPAWQYAAGTIAISVGEDFARCVHDGLDYLVTIERTRCNYGGWRPWFRCPTCGDRRAVLYRPSEGGRLGCRRCLKLLYLSECEDAFGRAILKVRKIERCICIPSERIVGMASLVGRPKGQHWQTYDRRAMALLAARVGFLRVWRAAQARS
jgi:hypothetical protein